VKQRRIDVCAERQGRVQRLSWVGSASVLIDPNPPKPTEVPHEHLCRNDRNRERSEYECHQQKHAQGAQQGEYGKARLACLEGRSYTVK
jgi:hypothetical protein